jgi:hypothetical protein
MRTIFLLVFQLVPRCIVNVELTLLILQSYGGFMSSKVVEANAKIHSLAMAVAVSEFPFLGCFHFAYVLGCDIVCREGVVVVRRAVCA